MKDLIERQAAIEALKYNQDVYSHNFHDDPIDKYTTAIIAADIDTLVKLPSAQPEPCGEVVSREVLVKFFDDWMSALDINCHHQSVADLMIIKGDIKNLPSAQPDLDEWCTDCKEYDKEKHHCPRFNRVIREALKDAQPEIIYCKDCVKHNIGVDDTPYKSYVCPLVKFRGKAQGHEFDYQYCIYGARKT